MEACTPPPSLLGLGSGPLSHVLRFLSVRDLQTASQVCRALHHAARDDTVWHVKALELYPEGTVTLGECYPTYQALVRDDNRQQAALLLDLATVSCREKAQQGPTASECVVLALEWCRGAKKQTFRLYIDARGANSLQPPGESSLGFLVHRGPPPDRHALRQQLEAVTARQQHLARQITEARAEDRLRCVQGLHHAMARCDTQSRQLAAELAQHLELSFADLLTVVRPAGQQLVVDTPGYKLGWLEFDALLEVSVLLGELPDSYRSKRQAQQQGVDLCFCYANPIPVMPLGSMVNWEPAIVATVLPGSSLLEAFKSRGRYVQPGQLLKELECEGAAARQQRWAEQSLTGRQPPPVQPGG
ncbi:hypothetical protein ACK3TF_002287 [Chlorella vulgaris]